MKHLKLTTLLLIAISVISACSKSDPAVGLDGPDYDLGYEHGYTAAGYQPHEDPGMDNYWYDLGYKDGELKKYEEAHGVEYPDGTTFVLDTEAEIFHLPGCDHIPDIKIKRRQFLTCTEDEAKSWGLSPCKDCFGDK